MLVTYLQCVYNLNRIFTLMLRTFVKTFSGSVGRNMREVLQSRANLTDLCTSAAANAIEFIVETLENTLVSAIKTGTTYIFLIVYLTSLR